MQFYFINQSDLEILIYQILKYIFFRRKFLIILYFLYFYYFTDLFLESRFCSFHTIVFRHPFRRNQFQFTGSGRSPRLLLFLLQTSVSGGVESSRTKKNGSHDRQEEVSGDQVSVRQNHKSKSQQTKQDFVKDENYLQNRQSTVNEFTVQEYAF